MSYSLNLGAFREPAQVIMHLPEQWTKILLLRTYGLGMADGGAYWDIPTEKIPYHLRSIGSRFVISGKFNQPQIPKVHGRESEFYAGLRFEELPESEKHMWAESKHLP
jgi:hypothetical protein